MSTLLAEVLDAFGGTPVGDGRYSIRREVFGSYVALGPTGQGTLLVPLTKHTLTTGRAFEGVTLDFEERILFQHAGRTWESPAAVLQCLDPDLMRTFAVLCVDIAEKVSKRPATTRDVLEALVDWETLLRAQQALSDADEIGLWGELWLLRLLGDAERALDAWRGPEGFSVDFVSAGIGLEVKTSRFRLRHSVSHDQVAIDREFPVFLVSLWVGVDPVDGRTLAELVSSIDEEVVDSLRWEMLLLRAGYRRGASSRHQARLVLLEPPAILSEKDVPRVHKVDPGVRQLRYVVELDASKKLEDEAWSDLLARFSS